MGNKKRQKEARKKAEKNKEPQKSEPQEDDVDVDKLYGEQIPVLGTVDEVYEGQYLQLLKTNPHDLKALGNVVAKRVELRRKINLLTEARERRRKEGTSITLELVEKVDEPVSNVPDTGIVGEEDGTKLSEICVEPILNASADDSKLNISYTTEYLLSLSELDSCTKLPDGFDQSSLETRSPESSDKDSDTQSGKDSDSFEVMRKEQHKASHENQKLQPEKKKGDFDFCILLDDNSKHEALLPTSNEIAEPLSPPTSNEDADKSTLPFQTDASRSLHTPASRTLHTPASRPLQTPASRPLQIPASRPLQTPASRPLIPPGFTSKRNFGTKSLNHPHQVEPHESKEDEAVRPHIVNSSKLAKWFNEADKKPANEIASGSPNDLFSSIVGNSQYLYKSTKPESVSAVLTCADPEREILSEMSEGLTLQLPVQRCVVPDAKAEQPKSKVDYHASQHLFSLLQKRIKPFSSVLTCAELERSIFSDMVWPASTEPSEWPACPEPSEVPFPQMIRSDPADSGRFHANMLHPPFLSASHGRSGFDAHHHPMLQQMQMAGNFPPPHLLQGLSSAPALPPHHLRVHPVMEEMNPMRGFPFGPQPTNFSGYGMSSPGCQLFEHQGPAGSDFNPEEEEEFRRENWWAFE